MARFLKSLLTGGNTPVTEWINIDVSQTIEVGDLIQIDSTSRLGEVATAASTTLFGIAEKAITTGASVVAGVDRIPVTLLKGALIRIDTTDGDLAVAGMYTTLYDLGTKKTLKVDDTTNGMLQVFAYDNTANTADVVVAVSALAVSI